MLQKQKKTLYVIIETAAVVVVGFGKIAMRISILHFTNVLTFSKECYLGFTKKNTESRYIF